MSMTKNDKRILKELERMRSFRESPPTFLMILRSMWLLVGLYLFIMFFVWRVGGDLRGALVVTGFCCGMIVVQVTVIWAYLLFLPTSLKITDWDKVDAQIKTLKSQE